MFTFWNTWRRSLRVLLFVYYIECRNRRWTSFSTYSRLLCHSGFDTPSSCNIICPFPQIPRCQRSLQILLFRIPVEIIACWNQRWISFSSYSRLFCHSGFDTSNSCKIICPFPQIPRCRH